MITIGLCATVGAADAVVIGCVIGAAAAADGARTGIAAVVAVGAGATVGAADLAGTGCAIGGGAQLMEHSLALQQ